MKRFLVALLVALTALALVPAIASATNADCKACHEGGASAPGAPTDFDLASVDRVTACNKCHWISAHPYHNAGARCGACHSGWGSADPARVPKVSTPAGWFNAASSAVASADELHAIHLAATWPAGADKPNSRCASCHAAAACSACHTVDGMHGDHTYDVQSGTRSAAAWTGRVATGTPAGDQRAVTATTTAVPCGAAGCHDLYSYSPPAPIEDSSPLVGYVGVWKTLLSATSYSGGSARYADMTGASASLTLAEGSFTIIGTKNYASGIADILLDGVRIGTVDFYSATAQNKQLLFRGEIPAGSHTLTILVTGTRNPSAGGSRVTLDAIGYSAAAKLKRPVCADCHPDKVAEHGYDPALHMSTETCFMTCHQPELKPVHDVATPPVDCSGCHATQVAEIKPWDKTCDACHPTLVPDHAPVLHVGTDVAYQDASFFGNGCSTSTGHTGQLACHDINSLAVLHSGMPDRGCSVCHGNGKTPKKECYDCHKPGYAASYTVPGPASSDIIATGTPSSDVSIAPAWTWTTTPAGQPVYAVVNSTYPPVDTTRYVSITSTSTGRMFFGWNRAQIPDNAVIRDVRIFAKARATNTTYPRRMRGAFKIGGQEYLSANQSANLTTAWTAGAGTGFYTSPTGVDFNRQPLYGETVWRNPATGQNWTPAELNGTDPDSSLEAFGLDLSGSTSANNVSFSQIYLKVTYYTVGASVTNTTVGTHVYHGNNVKYLHDPTDVPAGQRFAVNPAHGWYDALYYQDCYDFCHRGNGGDPTFSAEQGSWMWYSVGGDPTDPVVGTRTLTLKPLVIPAGAPQLTFRTNYQLGTGAAGYVEISTDGGGSWTPLTGTVGGASTSSLAGNAPGWVSASYDLSAYAGQSARLRFRYVNGSSGSAGWAFDTLVLGDPGSPLFSDDAEILKPDWDNRYWTRSMGAFPYQ